MAFGKDQIIYFQVDLSHLDDNNGLPKAYFPEQRGGHLMFMEIILLKICSMILPYYGYFPYNLPALH